MNTTYQHEVAAAIQELGGDKTLAIIEAMYRDGLNLYQEVANLEDKQSAFKECHYFGFCEAIEILRRSLLIATDRMPVVIAEESQYYHATAEEFGDEHHYAAAAAACIK